MDKGQRPDGESLDQNLALLKALLYDEKSTTDEQYADDLIKTHKQVVERNILLTSLLKNYVDSHTQKNKTNQDFKDILFYTFVLAFIVFTAAIIIVFIKTDLADATVPLVVSLLSVGATYLGSIFIAYEIMFKYLFPEDEEKDMISMIKVVIENDLKVEEFASLRLSNRNLESKTVNTRSKKANHG